MGSPSRIAWPVQVRGSLAAAMPLIRNVSGMALDLASSSQVDHVREAGNLFFNNQVTHHPGLYNYLIS